MQYLLFVVLAPIAAAITVGIAIYAWRHRHVAAATLLCWCALVITGWLICNTIELLYPSEAGTIFWARLTYLFIALAPVAWLAFALDYTGRHRWLDLRRLWLLGVLPAAFFVLTLTNDLHHLVWVEHSFHPEWGLFPLRVDSYGPWFWVQVIYNYSLVVLGAILIGQAYLRSHRPYRQQTLWAIAGAAVPLLFNLAYILRLVPGLRKDFSPLVWALGGLAFAVAIFRHRLLDLAPIARQVLVDRMADGLVVLDAHDRIIDLNPAAQAIVGASPDQVLGSPIAAAWGAWGSLPDTALETSDVPLELGWAREGRMCHYDVRISPLADRRGRRTGRLIILRDITRHKEADEALQRSNLELQARNADLDAFAQTVAHDVKGPLSIVAGHAEMLLEYDKELPEDLRAQFLRTMEEGARKAASIVTELLLLASVRRGVEVHLEVLDMAAVVAEALKRLAGQVEERKAEVIAPEEWPNAQGYAPWVEEVWVNYVSNAIQYGGIPPRVELGAREQEDGTVRFWVRDNGAGLTAEEQPLLFRPFTQLGQLRVTGHGLGLWIVRRIVEKMGGQAGVESTGVPGEGCTFSFVLPGVGP